MSIRQAIAARPLPRGPLPHYHVTRRRVAALLFFLIVGYGLAARDTISDARWIAILWLSWIPLLVAVWPDVPPTVPPLGRSALRMTMIFLSIMTLFSIQLLRVQVVMSDSITHRVGVDPATGDVISNPILVDEALTIRRGKSPATSRRCSTAPQHWRHPGTTSWPVALAVTPSCGHWRSCADCRDEG